MKITKKQKEIRFKIIDKIYSKCPISRIDISRETGITPATVSEITGNILNENLIYEIGEFTPEENKSGRKKILLDICDNHSFFIGSELSQKYISFCLTDNKGNIINEKIIKLDSYNFNSILTEEIYLKELQNFINNCKKYNPQGIGVAIPGHFDAQQKLLVSNNTFWKNFDIKYVIDNIELPFYFENNVHCMSLAERFFNSNNDENFLFLHVGNGMFCSYMYNGTLYEKNNFLVGEVGHIIVHPDGELCECGKRGCLQTYASEAWIIKKCQLLFDNSGTTFLKQLVQNKNEITINTVLKAYKLGDEGVNNILNSAIKYISITINNLAMMIGTDKIIVHGELFNEPLLLNLLDENIKKSSNLLSTEEQPNIKFKKYHSINGALSATSLCIKNILVGDIL
ncbi:MAG: ROK family protein [Clostridium sp.]|nr:ROK family protein [Clostridium sp.]